MLTKIVIVLQTATKEDSGAASKEAKPSFMEVVNAHTGSKYLTKILIVLQTVFEKHRLQTSTVSTTEYGEVATSSRASEPTSSTPLSPYASFIQVGMLIEHMEII